MLQAELHLFLPLLGLSEVPAQAYVAVLKLVQKYELFQGAMTGDKCIVTNTVGLITANRALFLS